MGSTFSVIMPFVAPGSDVFAAARAASGPLVARAAEGNENGEGPLVLVIEDDDDSASLLRETLEEAGYRVAVATDGRTGLRLVRDLRPVPAWVLARGGR